MTLNRNIFSELRLITLFGHYPFLGINKKYIKRCDLDLQMKILFQMNIIVLKWRLKTFY
jgi:hypothetical protein